MDASAQTGAAIVKGLVTDDSGAVIPGAKVSARGPGGAVRAVTSGADGSYSLAGLTPGSWTIVGAAPGLKQINPAKVEVGPSGAQTVNLSLSVVLEDQQVTVKENSAPALSTSADANVGAIVLHSEDLDALSDDPDEMQNDLQALAGPSAGPDGGQIYIDGFTGGTLPPKSSIREIRINQNPFSSEFDKLGYGRIEIFTKPGTDKWHGSGFFNASDSLFNARNPYSPVKPDFQSRQYGGNLSGSLTKKLSVFLDADRREIDDDAIVNAITLNAQLIPSPFTQSLATPQRRTNISPRIDYQLTPNNTLSVRYSYERNGLDGSGVGQFSLPTQAYNSLETENTVRVTDTMVINAKTIEEIRFQYFHMATSDLPLSTAPVVNVAGAFTDGGASIGKSKDVQDHYELQNYVSYATGQHTFKYGGRVRGVTDNSTSQGGYNGSFTFDSIDSYQATETLLQQGYTFPQIYGMCKDPTRITCAGPSQFTLTAGTPLSSVGQIDAGLFVQDDWRWKPNFTLSLGLRYEIQNNLSDYKDFAPRIGFAWAPGQSKATMRPKTVIRGGFGMFYTRFDDALTLQAERYNGVAQQQYLVNFPSFFTTNSANLPPISSLGGPASTNITTIDKALRAPYIMQTAISVERQLPKNSTISLTFTDSRGLHLLRIRDINAPLPGTYEAGRPVYPYGGTGQIDQFESNGILKQSQLILNGNTRFNSKVFLFAGYFYNTANSDTDGASTYPANTYDLQGEYGRSTLDIHHRIFMGGSVTTRWNIRLSPFLIYQSSRPYNIFIGRDLNGDGIFNDRPSFGVSSDPGAVQFGPNVYLNPNPLPGETIIPRNYGNAPGFFSLNLRFSKTFGFGPETSAGGAAAGGAVPGGGGGHDHGPGGGGRGPGGGGMFGDSSTSRKYNLTLGVQARNLLNTLNPGTPVGTLTSPIFGESNSLAGGFGGNSGANNRRIEFQLRFSF
jgi:hypothetical protein